jgi:hypothetical protein
VIVQLATVTVAVPKFAMPPPSIPKSPPPLIVRPEIVTGLAVVTLKMRKKHSAAEQFENRRTISWLGPGPEIDMFVLNAGSTVVKLIVHTPSTHFGSEAGILNWMVSVPAKAFASSIAARKVQGPLSGSVLLTPSNVPQTPEPGFASLSSPVLLTVKVAAGADTARANPINGTRSARILLRRAKEFRNKPDAAITPPNRGAVLIRRQNNWGGFMAAVPSFHHEVMRDSGEKSASNPRMFSG